jgi:hypothetical protein
MFKASLDRTAKITPYAMGAFALILIIVGFTINDKLAPWIFSFPSAVILVIILGCRAYMPLGYTIDSTSITVERKMGSFLIPRKDIQDTQVVTAEELGRTWRMAGNGGVFGYTGWFSSSKFGTMRWFATSREQGVLITMHSGKKFFLSPDDAKGFISALKK